MSDKVREAAENLVSVCDDLEAKSVIRSGGARMSGYWLQRDRIDPIREALADNAPPEPTAEMVEAGAQWLLRVNYDAWTEWEIARWVLQAALAAAQKERK